MKSIMKKSLAVVMVLSMLLSLALPTFAALDQLAPTTDNDPCVHAGTDMIVTKPVEATCVQNGGIWHICQDPSCGDVWVTDEVAADPDNHKWSTTAQSKEATCFSLGYTATIVCENEGCDAKQGGTVIPMRTHTVKSSTNPNGCLVLNTEKTTLEDCINGGKVEYMCEFKDALKEDGTKGCTYDPDADTTNNGDRPASGHKHELVTDEYQAPTCTEEGWVKLHCTECNEIVEVVAQPNPHSWVDVAEDPSTCLVAGYHKGGYCDAWWLVWDEDGNATKVTCGAFYKGDDKTAVQYEADGSDKDKESLRHDSTTQHDFSVKAEGANGEVITMPNGELSYKEAKCDPNLTAEEQGGWQYYYCSKDCGVYEKKEITADHERDTTITETRKNPTCTENGYIKYTCKNCGELYLAETLYAAHKFAGQTSATHKIVYIFVKDNAVYVNDGVKDEPLVLNNAAYNLTVRPYITEDLSDTKAVELLGAGYTATEWIEIDEADCGVMGTYVQYCTVCTQGFFLTVMTVHQWDGNAPTRVEPTCTTPGGYWGICSVCTHGYFLGQADDEQYEGEEAPLQHKKHDGTSAGMTGSTFNVPHAAEQLSTCITLGWNAFDYCDRDSDNDGIADCGYDTYETAKEKNMKTDYARHSYYAADGVTALKPVIVDPSCSYPGFQIAACAVDGCTMVYNLDPAVNGGNTIAYYHRIPNSDFGEFDGVSHVYPTFADGKRPYAVNPTCATPGRYVDVQCTLCPYTDIGGEVAVLDPGEIPTWNASMTDGQKIGGWIVDITDATCTQPGKVEVYCEECGPNNEHTATHTRTTIHEFSKTGVHFVKDAMYKMADGTYKKAEDLTMDDVINDKLYKFKGSFVVVKSSLKSPLVNERPADFVYNEGTCNEAVNDLHAEAYACAMCGGTIAFSVRLDHTKPATPPACGEPEKCTGCDKVLTNAVPHNMVVVTDPTSGEIVYGGTANDCTKDYYKHIICTTANCGYGSQTQGFTWTDEYKALAEYREAKTAHTYNVENATCLTDKYCTVDYCDEVAETATNHAGSTRVYTNPNCIAKGFWTVKCPAGELCDKFVDKSATLVEEGGVKYATWDEVDDASTTTAHSFKTLITQERTCLTFGVVVEVCEYCALTEDATYRALNLKDAHGHELIKVQKDFTCSADGYYQMVCKHCFNLGVECVAPDHTTCDKCETLRADEKHNTPDWENKLGYKAAEVIPSKGHWYYAEGTTQEQIDNDTAERVYFNLDCMDLLAHNDPTCDECGVTFLAKDYHVLSKTYELLPTCTTSGLVWEYCTNEGCGHKNIKKVEPATGHTDLYWRSEEGKAPTCCAQGEGVLACGKCGADVQVGDLINDEFPASLTEIEVPSELPYAATEDMLTATLAPIPHQFDEVITNTEATPSKEGVLEKRCSLKCGPEGEQCKETEKTTTPALDEVNFSATIDNAVKPGYAFVNGGKIAYTVYIDGGEKDVFGLNFYVRYDASKLTFAGYDLPIVEKDGEEIRANIFGVQDERGAEYTNTSADAGVIVEEDENGEPVYVDVVSVLGYASPIEDEEGNRQTGYATLNDKTAFVVIYFDINADTLTDNVNDKNYYTDLAISDVIVEAPNTEYGDTTSEELQFSNDYTVTVEDGKTIRVEKLGDVNVIVNGSSVTSDGVLNVRDINAIEKLALASEYDARADINQDGEINGADILALKRYIVMKDSYAEMVGAE